MSQIKYKKLISAIMLAAFEDPPAGSPQKPGEGERPKTFTQEELNTILATERKKQEQKFESATSTLKLTEQQKQQLAQQLEDARNEGLTKQEQLTRELERTKKEFSEKLESATKTASTWESQYKSSLIETHLTNASVANKAFNPTQIHAILSPQARVVEVLDAEQKPTGRFGVKVKINTVDKDKKAITLDLSPEDAVKHISETAEFANLFQGKHIPGLGGSGGPNVNPGGEKIDISKMSHADYVKHRDAILASQGKR